LDVLIFFLEEIPVPRITELRNIPPLPMVSDNPGIPKETLMPLREKLSHKLRPSLTCVLKFMLPPFKSGGLIRQSPLELFEFFDFFSRRNTRARNARIEKNSFSANVNRYAWDADREADAVF